MAPRVVVIGWMLVVHIICCCLDCSATVLPLSKYFIEKARMWGEYKKNTFNEN